MTECMFCDSMSIAEYRLQGTSSVYCPDCAYERGLDPEIPSGIVPLSAYADK